MIKLTNSRNLSDPKKEPSMKKESMLQKESMNLKNSCNKKITNFINFKMKKLDKIKCTNWRYTNLKMNLQCRQFFLSTKYKMEQQNQNVELKNREQAQKNMIDTLKAEIERVQKSNLDLCQLLSKNEEEFSLSMKIKPIVLFL